MSKRRAPTRPQAAIAWLRAHNALVRFESDRTVSVKVNRTKRRRPTLALAILAVEREFEATREVCARHGIVIDARGVARRGRGAMRRRA